MLVAKNPDDEDERIVAVTKNNLAPHPSAMAYTITRDDATGRALFAWVGESAVTGDQLLTTRSTEEKQLIDEAAEFLIDELESNGGAMQVTLIQGRARAMGFSDATVRRAREKSPIDSKKEGAHWVWRIKAKDKEDAHPNDEHLEHLESENQPSSDGKMGWVNAEPELEEEWVL
jgi:hypothetical protein